MVAYALGPAFGRQRQISVHLSLVWVTNLVLGQLRLSSDEILLEKRKKGKKEKQKRRKCSREFIFCKLLSMPVSIG